MDGGPVTEALNVLRLVLKVERHLKSLKMMLENTRNFIFLYILSVNTSPAADILVR